MVPRGQQSQSSSQKSLASGIGSLVTVFLEVN